MTHPIIIVLGVVSSTRWGGVVQDGDVVVAVCDDISISATAVLKYDLTRSSYAGLNEIESLAKFDI